MSDSEGNIEVVRSYMKALQDGEAGDSLRRFFTQDVRQIEMPNQLNPRGQESSLEQILQRSLQGLQILNGKAMRLFRRWRTRTVLRWRLVGRGFLR
jgi:limonene-1,2-epoxide hydrolase